MSDVEFITLGLIQWVIFWGSYIMNIEYVTYNLHLGTIFGKVCFKKSQPNSIQELSLFEILGSLSEVLVLNKCRL